MKKNLFVFTLLLLPLIVNAGKVGVVVDDGTRVLTRCVSFSGPTTPLQILRNSGLNIVVHEDPSWGIALCKIGSVGCPSDNCFNCNPPYYWAFSRMENGVWVHATAGVACYNDPPSTGLWGKCPDEPNNSSPIIYDGAIIGFKWVDWNAWPAPQPPLYSFEEICPPAVSESYFEDAHHFNMSVNFTCAGEPAKITVLEGTTPIQSPSLLIESDKFGIINGAYVKLFRKSGWWVLEKAGETDENGTFVFTPKSGIYTIDVSKRGFIPTSKFIVVEECNLKQHVPEQPSSSGQLEVVGLKKSKREEIDKEVIAQMLSLVFHFFLR